MDPVILMVCVILGILLICMLFEAGLGSKIFGIEYFEEKYSFQKPMAVEQIRNSFMSLQLIKYQKKNLHFNIDMKTFYSIGHDGCNDWSSWRLFEYMPHKSFEDYDIRYKSAWIITIYNPDLDCAVYHDDSSLLYEGDVYPEIRLVGLGIVKYPWNRRKIKNERQFLADVASALKEVEVNVRNGRISWLTSCFWKSRHEFHAGFFLNFRSYTVFNALYTPR